MHELSMAYNLVTIAQQAAEEAGGVRVKAVHLRLGVFSGVVKDALLFGYEIATQGTLLEGSRLEISDVPLVVHCHTCDRDVTLESVQMFRCPHCGEPTPDIRQGREIEIEYLEVEDATETA
ncbi:MAG: hydrogenase maturation nickel metallochaperone HypA [Anaerolineae bacterium]|nr:hydrogenase maturation nickel metallochaperone HypA [Anaerolineae bacterium]